MTEKYYGGYIQQPLTKRDIMFLDVDYFLRKITTIRLKSETEK